MGFGPNLLPFYWPLTAVVPVRMRAPQAYTFKPHSAVGVNWDHPLNRGLREVFLFTEGAGEGIGLINRLPLNTIGGAGARAVPRWTGERGGGRAYPGTTVEDQATWIERGNWCEPTKGISVATYFRRTTSDIWLGKILDKTYNNGAFPYTSYCLNVNPAYAGQNYVSFAVNCAGIYETDAYDCGDLTVPTQVGGSWGDGGSVRLWVNGRNVKSTAETAGTIDYDTGGTGRFVIAGNDASAAQLTRTVGANIYWIQIWDRELSSEEWLELYSHPFGTPENPRFVPAQPEVWFAPAQEGPEQNWVFQFGMEGCSGASGYSGYGSSGYSGAAPSGFSGYRGFGDSGFSGYSGISGYSGDTAPSGYSGGSGLSGSSGYSAGGGDSGLTRAFIIPDETLTKPVGSEFQVNREHPVHDGMTLWYPLLEGVGASLKEYCTGMTLFYGIPNAPDTGMNVRWAQTRRGCGIHAVQSTGFGPHTTSMRQLSDVPEGTSMTEFVFYGSVEQNVAIGGFRGAGSLSASYGLVCWTGSLHGLTCDYYSNGGANNHTLDGPDLTMTEFEQRMGFVAFQTWNAAGDVNIYAVGRSANIGTGLGPIYYRNDYDADMFNIAGGKANGVGNYSAPVIQTAIWNRILSIDEMLYLQRHPWGTPDNPRLLPSSPRKWFVSSGSQAVTRKLSIPSEPPTKPVGAGWKANPDHPLNQGLGVWLLLNEGSGNYLHNVAGPEIFVAPAGPDYWSVGARGPQLGGTFSYTNQYYFYTPVHTVRTPIAVDGAYTVSAWVLNLGTTQWNSLFDVLDGPAGGYTNAVVGISTEGYFFGYVTEDHTMVCGGTPCPTNRWVLVTWVVRSASDNGYLDVYVDGKLWDSQTHGSATAFASERAWSYGVGLPRDYGSFEWNECRASDLQFWNRALSADEVWRLYQSYFGSQQDPPRLLPPSPRSWFVTSGGGGGGQASGYSGYSGESGYSGISGYSAVSGYSGYSSYSGYGSAGLGTSGYSGYSGFSGTSGYSSTDSGYSGFPGKSGYCGHSGISGVSGRSGYSSPQSGYSGYSGMSGYCGHSGYSGYSSGSGYSGDSGYSGSGFSGYSGLSGFKKSSDIRLKREIERFTDGIEVVEKINPVFFKYNQLWEPGYDNIDRVGIIAQEVEPVAPRTIWRIENAQLYAEGEPTDVLIFDYAPMVFILVNAVKQMDASLKESVESVIGALNGSR